MSRFHRPYSLLEPVDQREIISRATKQRLAEMDMRLHKPRQQYAAARVDHFGALVSARLKRLAKRSDAAAFDEHVAIEDVVLRVERENGRTFDKQRFAHEN